ncbi:Putative ABC-transporter type IV [Lutispora thermophila DSM 19022]|uniref:Putative ABC-transporter type IV n=2 Tax=Lutispora TaxID=667112 RepID=A0A1M6FTT6_9FIRM|nr:Putative ABC-transporter type IV [Lutispora thermophila DSM 19022]
MRGGVWVLTIFAIEYLCGWALDSILGHCPWDYGEGILSINGYIRLDFTVAWFFTGLLYEKVHDFLTMLQNISNNNYMSKKE